ncbi:MAG TPA: winged helix-turn-helix domain-containing protein [Polyangiaceae bacterium]|nr:winged helix-turn-helix domain-containing protein [Polyangiaceae bacterium]
MVNPLPETALQIRPKEALPAVVVNVREPGSLESAVSGALQAADLRQGTVAIVLVPLGAPPPPWLARISDNRPSEEPDELTIDVLAREVTLNGEPVILTSREFALLHYLNQRRGAVVTREALLRDVWGERYRGGSRTVDIHVRRLRAKLGAERFETFRGIGYKFRRR